jgi:hypothetical protein
VDEPLALNLRENGLSAELAQRLESEVEVRLPETSIPYERGYISGSLRALERVRDDWRFLIRTRLHNRLGAALRCFSRTGKVMRADQYGVDYAAIIAHLGPCPGPRELWHVDHIRPLCAFDLTDPAQVREAFAPENHRWLPAEQNLAKRVEDMKQRVRSEGA